MNITDLIRRHAESHPDATAIGPRERSMTYAQLDAAIAHVAERLAAQGLAPGDLVGVAMGASAVHVATVLALARIGAISVPVSPNEKVEKRQGIAKRYAVKAIVATKRENAVEGVPLLLLDPDWKNPPQGFRARDAAAGGDAPWRIVLTSGTTGVPKGVAWTHARTAGLFERYQDVLPFRPGNRLLCSRGFDIGFMTRYWTHVLFGGGTLVIVATPSYADFIEAIERRKLTHAIASPQYLQGLVRNLPEGKPRLPQLAHLSVGGGVLSPELSALAQERLTPNVFNSHGAAETGLTALAGPRMIRASPETTGRVVSWVEAQAVDEDGEVLPEGRDGILRYRSRYFPDGYYDDPAASAKSFRDGWFYPGDYGNVARGMLRLAGRSDDIINLGGLKLNPVEIESVLTAHPAVEDAAAFEGRLPDGARKLFAAVVVGAEVDLEALRAHFHGLLGRAAPAKLVRVDRLPRNDAGKLVRRELAAIVK